MLADSIRYVTEGTVPDALSCPLSLDLVKRPVCIEGDTFHVYEESDALRALSEKRKDPMTRVPVVTSRPLQRDPRASEQAFGLRSQAARFERAFGDPESAAARTIQAHWLRHAAKRAPAQPVPFARVGKAQTEMARALQALAWDSELLAMSHAPALQTITDQGAQAAARAAKVAARAAALRPLGQVTVDWDKVGAAATPALAQQLAAALNDADATRLDAVAEACTTAGHSLRAMLLADGAAPLRWLLDQGQQLRLRACAEWIAPGVYADGRFAFDAQRGSQRVWGPLNAQGALDGRGLQLAGDGTLGCGDFRNGVPQGRFCVKAPDGTVRQAGQFDKGQALGLALVRGPAGTFTGLLTRPAGDLHRKQPILHGFGTFQDPAASQFIGRLADATPEVGRWTFPDSAVVVDGALDRQHKEAVGTLRFPDRSVYYGQFAGQQPQGTGVLHRHGGRKQGGAWSQGELLGPGFMSTAAGISALGLHAGGEFLSWGMDSNDSKRRKRLPAHERLQFEVKVDLLAPQASKEFRAERVNALLEPLRELLRQAD